MDVEYPNIRPFPDYPDAYGEARQNIDEPFDVFSEDGSGGGAPGAAAFAISDATEAGIEQILVSPGLLEVINGGFSTFITPTLGGDPITDQTPIVAVTGVVYLEVTLNASGGRPASAAVKNSASLPTDTATLKHIQIGEITVGTSVVTVDAQDVFGNVLYHVRGALPWAVVQTGPASADILYAPLVTNVLTGATTTVTGLTGYTLTSTTKFWLKTTFTGGTPSAYEVTDTGPTGNLFVYSGSSQTEAWHLIAEVVSGSQPSLQGFDFTLSGDPYHLTQKAFTEFEAAVGCVNGKSTWRVRPR